MKNSSNEFEISLRIIHPNMDPDRISTELGLKPDITHHAGQQRPTPKGTLLEGVHNQSYWSRRLVPNLVGRISDLIASSNGQLRQKENFLAELHKSGGKIEYFIGLYPSPHFGETFDWSLLEQCAQLKINLAFDIYSDAKK